MFQKKLIRSSETIMKKKLFTHYLLIKFAGGILIIVFSFMSAFPVFAVTNLSVELETNPTSTPLAEPTKEPKEHIPEATPQVTPEPIPEAMKPFSIVWISDTQTILSHGRTYLQDMTRYAEEHREELNAICLLHTGDISENLNWPSQRRLVLDAFEELKKLPVLAVAGNHDFGKTRSDYRPYTSLPVVKNIPDTQKYKDGRGVYSVFKSGDTEIVLVGLSYGTKGVKEAQKWARDIFLAHPNAVGIFFCHQFVTKSGTILADNQYITDIIAKCPNVRLVLCGHSRCIAHLELSFKDDPVSDSVRLVNVICFDYQSEDPLTGSYMQFLTFDPATRSISVISYSPSLDDFVCHDDEPDKESFVLQNAF